ncbi:SDR family NAD(P)-dependent oxidoreductase [Bailinhaonella thermotolerans]|uniref:SDR family NAD(P)-dependent oxidoreductase n=1 Tax=Bailinhaonella thermotolerans TaxID=1070861 RepID=A0A3A4A520_9ACTN|nr:SDR family NAD(P)-dependent oxidoreductase [Bailinhaonella thermotolerans]RJL23615.1 SDR family NAD(P)-dependent oxidoreductase [Bailinhaonella thermotolerans]
MKELGGGVAVVTGGGSGIGRALALRFAREGMSLVLADVEEGPLAETSALAARAGAATVLTQVTDVSDAAAVRHLADRAFGELRAVHVLCNNAGVFTGGHMWTRGEEDFAWALGVNLWGVLHGIRSFVPRMIEQDTEGHIVNTISIAGLFATPYAGPYCVSKFAALAATQSLAHDLAFVGSKLKVSALCPAGVRTRIHEAGRNRPEDLAGAGPTEDSAVAGELIDRIVEKGVDPAHVADLVVEGIREERFLILTHPETRALLAEQARALADGGLPPLPPF